MRKEKRGYRIAGGLEVTDRIMTDTFWIGVYPGMTDEMLDRMIRVLAEAVRNN
jgi:CDP-6-deoxy-D-xylo-4-hexulose-3-dehydrase